VQLSTKSAPRNIEAEQALLGAILVNNKAFYCVSDFLVPKHFFEPAHQRIFEIAGSFIRAGKLASPVTLQSSLPSDLQITGFTGNKYLARLAAEAATIHNAEDYGRTVHELAIGRQVVAICEEGIENAQRTRLDRDPHEPIVDLATKLRRVAEDDDHLSSRRKPKWIDMSNWDNEPVPERKWAIRDRVPANQAGLFSGEGGTGKSIVELTKDVAHVTGKDWLGSLPELGPAFYFGAEDDENEIHIRLAAIAKHYGVTFKELVEDGLHVRCLLGEDATLCAVVNGKSGTLEVTKLYRQIYEQAGDIKPKNISIDTLSRAFAGNEIDRVQVYAFANHMQALAKVAGGSVTVLSHPSLAGIASGSGISGSTAWHGAFRFRQYLKGVTPESGEQPDGDLRQLEFKKNQYGPTCEAIILRYQGGLFLPEQGMSNLDKVAREAAVDEAFLAGLKTLTEQGRDAMAGRTSPDYGPARIANLPATKSLSIRKRDLQQAMERLLAANKIHIGTIGPPSKAKNRICLGARVDG
jgi:RecA-family ATPase